jgi:cardiolipin synthase (CMP-forming)
LLFPGRGPMSTPILTVANQLTILRMALVPFLVLAVLSREFTWALVIFVVAGVSDLLDGLIARLGHQKTTLGAMLDPVADKLLLSSSFIVLTWGSELGSRVPLWLTVITLSRDAIIVVSVTVINLTVGRRIFFPSFLGKATTVAQITSAGVVLLQNALATEYWETQYLFYATVVLTVASALHYVHLASMGRGSSEP